MDPNQALEDARARVALLDATDVDDLEDSIGLMQEAIEAYRALDEWLPKGGFFPNAWLVKR